MVKTINVLVGRLILVIAFTKIKSSSSFKKKYLKVMHEIIYSRNKSLTLPTYFTKSIILIEDKRYYSHNGVDLYSIMRAILKNLTSSRLEGASTITQQLVRIITEERELKLKRKINEVLIAVLIENKFSKKEILEAYVNLYQFHSCIGVFNLCKIEKYDINRLSNHECFEIAARFKYPIINRRNYIKFLKRVRTIEKKTTPNSGYQL